MSRAKKTSREKDFSAAEKVAAMLEPHILKAPTKRLARLTAVVLAGRVFTDTTIAAAQMILLDHAINLTKTDDPGGPAAYKKLSRAAQTEFWRSLALHHVTRMEDVPADKHTDFWAALSLAAAKHMDAIEKGRTP